MKRMKIWRNIFIMLAAFSLASCSSDDDDTISEAEANRALFVMKKDYIGKLRCSIKNESTRQTLQNVIVRSDKELQMEIPLDLIADQVKDETIAKKIREWETAKIQAPYEFIIVDGEYFSFHLFPEMAPDERFTKPITRSNKAENEGLQLMFDTNYTGSYTSNEGLIFNINVCNVLINHKPVEGFKPVVYTYEGEAYHISETLQKSD